MSRSLSCSWDDLHKIVGRKSLYTPASTTLGVIAYSFLKIDKFPQTLSGFWAEGKGICKARGEEWRKRRNGKEEWGKLRGLPFSVLPASSTQTSRPFLDHRCSQDGDPGVCILTPGLLQLTVIRHLRQLDTTTTSGSERCVTSSYWYAEARSYQPSPSAAALVTSSPAYKV